MAVALRKEDGIGYIEFDAPDSKMNILTGEVLQTLDGLIDQVKEDAALTGLVILSKKKDVFIAGADIKEIESIVEVDDGVKKAQFGQNIFNKIEDLAIPSVAVVDGVCLGGGCELILSCTYRVATSNDKVKIGLPEVGLGFIPGFGGTYRMPRVVGLSTGLTMILTQKQVDGARALKIGLVDRVIPTNDYEYSLNEFIDSVIKRKKHPKTPRVKPRNFGQSLIDNSLIGNTLFYYGSIKKITHSPHKYMAAPYKAIEVISKTFYVKRDKGMLMEAKGFGELAVTDISKNCVRIFNLWQKFKKLSAGENVSAQEVNKCGVLGAGVMGGGIAQLLSSRDILTRLKDINWEAIASAYQEAGKIYGKGVKIRKLTPNQAKMKMGFISSTLDYSGFSSTDMVIEAVVENMDIKKSVFKELSDVCNENTVLATNTSALSVTEMASVTKDPSKVVGLHFFNPVFKMPLVEIITTEKTSDETIATTLNLVKKLGKTPIVCKDSCGFVVNRILLSYINEAGRILEETGQMKAIDKVMTDFGMPMGPFLLTDEVGIDVGYKVLKILYDGFGGHFEPVSIFGKVFDDGLLGKKGGKGFYVHKKRREINHDIKKHLPRKLETLDGKSAQDRMTYIMINEAARCLEEGVVDDPDAIDVGMLFGTGFPLHRGGLLKYADSIGIKRYVDNCSVLNELTQSDRFTPCGFIMKLKEQEKGFLTT